MRSMMLLAAGLMLSCGGAGGPAGTAGPGNPPPDRRPPAARAQTQPRTGPPVRTAPRPRPRPKRWVAQLQGREQAAAGKGAIIALVAAGSTLVSVTREARKTWLKGWHAGTRKLLWKIEAPARRVELALAADGKSMVVTTPAGTNHIYQLSAGKPKAYRKWKRKRGRNKGRSQGLSADGSMLIRGDVRGQVRGYALDKYKMMWLVKGERVVVSTDGKTAMIIRGRTVQMFNAVTGRTREPALTLPGKVIDLASHSRKYGAFVLRQAARCILTAGSINSRPVVCIPQMKLTWSPGAKLLAIAGQGVARIISRLPYKLLSEHTSRLKAPLRVAFPTDKTFVLANETAGQLSFYRMIKR